MFTKTDNYTYYRMTAKSNGANEDRGRGSGGGGIGGGCDEGGFMANQNTIIHFDIKIHESWNCVLSLSRSLARFRKIVDLTRKLF